MATDLWELIYASTATGPIDIPNLLRRARKRNAGAGLTGLLLASRGSFFQLLEGTQLALDSMFARISADDRHRQILTVRREAITRRAFGEWKMGFFDLDGQAAHELAGIKEFIRGGAISVAGNPGLIRDLFAAFRKESWRAMISS